MQKGGKSLNNFRFGTFIGCFPSDDAASMALNGLSQLRPVKMMFVNVKDEEHIYIYKEKFVLPWTLQLKVDAVVPAVGLEPNVDLARASDLEVDPDLGGFLVNAELEARTDVWVVGR